MVSARRRDLDAHGHQRRRLLSAWLTGDAELADTEPDRSVRWLLAGLVAGGLMLVLTAGGTALGQDREVDGRGGAVSAPGCG